jgi:hypothetical protein
MNIEGLVRELGTVDSAALIQAVLAQEDAAWNEDNYRQETYEVHRQTESIVLVFVDMDDWPKFEVRKEPGWDRLAAVAFPVMHDTSAGATRQAARSSGPWRPSWWREERSNRMWIHTPLSTEVTASMSRLPRTRGSVS